MPEPPPAPGAPPPWGATISVPPPGLLTNATVAAPPPAGAVPPSGTVAVPPPQQAAAPAYPRAEGPPLLAPGARRAIGRYQVLGEIARGGMGAVLRAYDPHLRVERAIKVQLGDAPASPEDTERFLRESRLLARLRHPNIIVALEAGFDGGHPYLVLPLVEGGSLANLVARGPLEPRRAAELMDRVARAMDFAHGEGVVHRDLKPQNVLLDREGTPFVTDFGVARDAAAREHLTRTGALLGTPAYMSPEQAAGDTPAIGPRTDVYALGAMLYELLTGKPPFEGPTLVNVLSAVLGRPPRPIRSLRPDVPPDLAAIAHQALEKSASERYDSAAALAADLRRWLEGRPVLARSLGPVGRLATWLRRRPLVAGSLAVGLAAALTAGGAAARTGWVSLRHALAEEAVVAGGRAASAGDAGLARSEFARATSWEPERRDAWRGRLDAAQALGDREDAGRAAQALVSLPGATTGDHVRAAELARADGRGEAARALLAAAPRPADEEGATALAGAHLALEDTARALGAVAPCAGAPALRLRARAWAALGAPRAAELDRWAVLRQAPRDVDTLGELVRARLDALDVEGLTRLWEVAHRELALPGEASLQRLTVGHAQEAASEAVATDPSDAADRRRLRACIAAPVLAWPGQLDALVARSRDATSPIVAEAAWSSLLALDLASVHHAWVEHAVAQEDGAAQAMTLLEHADLLEARVPDVLARLAERARGATLREGVALAAARARARGARADSPAGQALDRLAEGPEPERARRLAETARAALSALGLEDARGAPPDARALRLASGLAEPAQRPAGVDPDELRARLRATLERTRDAAPEASLTLARLALEDGDLEAAGRHASALLPLVAIGDPCGEAAGSSPEGASEWCRVAAPSIEARELAALIAAARGDEPAARAALDAAVSPLPELVPRDLAEARSRLDLALALASSGRRRAGQARGLVVVPLPGGRTRLVTFVRGREDLEAAFEVSTSGPTAELDDGLECRGVVTLRALFGLEAYEHVRLGVRTPPAGALALVRLQPDPAARDGRLYKASVRLHPNLASVDQATPGRSSPTLQGPIRELAVQVRRAGDELRTVDDRRDAPAVVRLTGPLEARQHPAGTGLYLEWGWAPEPCVARRLVVDGVLDGRPAPARRSSAAARASFWARAEAPGFWVPAPDLPVRWDPRVAPATAGRALPATLRALEAGALELPSTSEEYVGAIVGAPVVRLGPLRGAVRVSARVRCQPTQPRASWVGGLGVRHADGEDRVHVGLHPLDGREVEVLAQRQWGVEWELPLASRPSSREARLQVERLGARARIQAGSLEGPLETLADVDWPTADPLEVFLYSRLQVATTFEDVRVEVERAR